MMPNVLQLVKVQALGNDFLLVEASAVAGMADLAAFARRACNRHHGIGADGLMLLESNADGAASRLLNADGSAAEVSGNGVRSAAAWLAYQRSLEIGGRLVVGTVAGPKHLELVEKTGGRYTFRADMGAPTELRRETLEVAGETVSAVVLRVGNPQCVVLGDVTEERLHRIGRALATHRFFPDGTNVELAHVESPTRVRILIWERGVGPTEASGTGACAAAVAAAFSGGATRRVDVVSPGGTQLVEWTDETIFLTGWAEIVARLEFWLG